MRIAEKFEEYENRGSLFGGWSTRPSAVNEPLVSGVRNDDSDDQ